LGGGVGRPLILSDALIESQKNKHNVRREGGSEIEKGERASENPRKKRLYFKLREDWGGGLSSKRKKSQ